MASLSTRALEQLRTSLADIKTGIAAIVRGDLERLDRYIVFLMPLVFASFYVLPKTEQRYLIYIGCLLPMVLYVRPAVFQVVRREPAWWLTMGLCALWVLSIGWSENLTHESAFDTFRIGVAVALFMHAGIWLARQGKLPQQRIMTAILATAAVLGTFTILLSLIPGTGFHNEGRLIGFGWAGHAGIGGGIYAFAGLIALAGLTDTSGKPARSVLILVFALGLCTFYTLLTESRGAVLALVTTGVLCVMLSRPRLLLTIAAVTALAAGAAHLAGMVDFGQWLERGSASRLAIWNQALTWYLDNPILGLGAADTALLDAGRIPLNSAHNIFIAMALDLGAVGLALFLALTLLMFWRALAVVRAGQGPLLFTLLAYGYMIMQFHTQTVMLMPAREWLIFWLPLLLLVQAAAGRQATPSPDATPS